MAKFIVTGDWHFKGINPRARLDNYQEALTRKIYEVYDLANQHGAKAIIVPGDIFDSPGTGLGTIAEFALILQLAPCPVLAIAGNHDIWAGNEGSKYRTPYGFLSRLGLLYDLSQEPFELLKGEAVAITGHSFTAATDTKEGMGQFSPPPRSGEWIGCSIQVVHSMLLERSPGFEIRHTLMRDVRTEAQVVISGHDHIGFGVKRRGDGVLFINPGALCRLSAHPAEIERSVQVALLTVEDGTAEASLLELQSARPGHEVLSRAHLEAEAEQEERMSRFLGLLAAEGERKFLEVREIVLDLAQREALPKEVVDEALARLGKAREELGVA